LTRGQHAFCDTRDATQVGHFYSLWCNRRPRAADA